jgi:hypothetical protein
MVDHACSKEKLVMDLDTAAVMSSKCALYKAGSEHILHSNQCDP